ncbi:hypothetical protein [Brevibacillus laterosporus]|uniref:Uncharacterized protein n=1 Tax=Brevibacillus laterosporus TaxID=1465 RepID=A0AAP8QG19_BRELA|nr:hypothetical protein [Brevibacillus laterosporus]PPB08656.1 hypothetical protein C4A77_07510 [Brevibacillus laterosporus]
MNTYKDKQKTVALIIALFIFLGLTLMGLYNLTRTNLFYVNLVGLLINSFMLFVTTKTLYKKVV